MLLKIEKIIIFLTSRNDDYDESIVTLLSTGASIVKVDHFGDHRVIILVIIESS